MRANDFSGSHAIKLMASSKCRRTLRSPLLSMPASALAMPLTNGSTPIKPAMRLRLRPGDHRFAAAEADFEINFGDGERKQFAELDRSGAGEIKCQLRQHGRKAPRLVGAQLMSLAPSEKRAGLDCLAFHHCRARQSGASRALSVLIES